MKQELYQWLREYILSRAEDAGTEVEWIGKFSNGDRRPIIRVDGEGDSQLLIIGGEDENEIFPVFSLSRTIEKLGKNISTNVNIIPFFDISPSLEEILDTDESINSYTAFKEEADDCIFYEEEKIRELSKNRDKKGHLKSEDILEERVVDFIGKIENGFDHWFTAVTEPGVELTNNRTERALREHVVQRKIIGTLRSEKDMRIHETIMTLLATWKRKGLDPYEEMCKAIRS